MSNIFNHFVITRFNLKQSIWNSDKNGVNVNDEQWLLDRYKLFETYCFPSLEAQTLKDFIWLVFFDKDTPDIFKLKNEGLKNKCSNFLPVYVSDFLAFETLLPKKIKELAADDITYIITTRLDNDDSLHKDAVKTIQENFIEEDHTIIDLQNGFALELSDTTHRLSMRKGVISGPFISYVETVKKDKELLTVYNREHLKWIGDANYVNITKGFYWLQLIHKRNISNALSNILIAKRKCLKGFIVYKDVRFSFKYRMFVFLKQVGFFDLVHRKN
jgi:hypothetical protein